MFNFNNRGCCSCNNQMPDCSPIMEAPIEKCVQKDIIHEIEHICPINTKIINNHIFKHVYIPQYSCCEEDVYTNVDECGCASNLNNFDNYNNFNM